MVLEISVEKKEKGVFIIKPSGRVDADTCHLLKKEIKKLLVPSVKVLILDMAGVEYISSSGIGLIFETKKDIERIKGSLVLSNLQPHVKKVFEIVKALPVLSLFGSAEELDRYLENLQKRDALKPKRLHES